MKFVSLIEPTAVPHQIHTYAELRQQIHHELRIQHPEWVQPNGESPSVILTKCASWNCSIHSRERDPTSLSLILIASSNRELEGKQ